MTQSHAPIQDPATIDSHVPNRIRELRVRQIEVGKDPDLTVTQCFVDGRTKDTSSGSPHRVNPKRI